MNTTLIRGGRVALPFKTGIRLVESDLEIKDGKIAAIGAGVGSGADEVIDARHLLVMPGVIDPQVHFREPGLTHKEDIGSGSRAAAAGGVTAFLEMPNTRPPTTTIEALEAKQARAAATSLAHYGFFVGATPDNLSTLVALDRRDDVPGIKIFMGSSTGTLLVDKREDLDRIFAHGHRPIAVHAEDEARLKERILAFSGRSDPEVHSEIRDETTAVLATELALDLSEKHGRRLHVLHLSTAREVELLRARGKGAGRVTAEVTPQHLLLHAPEAYRRLGTWAQMNPPLRSEEHSAALWAGLRDGTLDCIATDHAPHTREEKSAGYPSSPSGMPGVETALALMLDAAHRGLSSVEQVVAWMTEAPARVWRIIGKGRIELGYDADLALVDLGLVQRIEDRKIRSRAGWNPFEGVPLTGWPVCTILAGQTVFRDGEIVEAPGAAQPLRFSLP
jgi:dihydroorotase